MSLYFAESIFVTWYWFAIFLIIPASLLILTVSTIWLLFNKRRLRKQGKPLSSFYFIKILIIVATITIAGYEAYNFYLDQRTGSLNPATEDCKKFGYEGAKGNECTGTYNPAKAFNQSPENPYRSD